MPKVKPITDEQLAILDRLEREVGIDSDSGERFDDEVLFMYPGLRERIRQPQAMAAQLEKLIAVAEAARDAAIQMHCMCRPHKICEKCDLLKELEKLEGEG